MLDIRNERGEQLMRQVVGVGVLQPGERRRLNVSVEMLPVRSAAASKSQAPAADRPHSPRSWRPSAPKPAPVAPAAATAAAAAGKSTGPQQPANLINSTAAAASMQRLGIIRKPR